MKRYWGLFITALFLFMSIIPIGIYSQIIMDRASFHAELGINDYRGAQIELNGNPRNLRDGHVIVGTANFISNERTFRFQGLFTRNTFFIQSVMNTRVINIVGAFSRYDEDTQTYYGQWRGFIVGYGFTRGWIEASFI